MLFIPFLIYFLFYFVFLTYSYHVSNINRKVFRWDKLKYNFVKRRKKDILNLQRELSFTIESFPCKTEIINHKEDYFFKNNKTFSDLNVHKILVEQINKNNINVASIIQSDLLDFYNKNYENLKNIIIGAENGIGKTLSYIIFILNHLLKHKKQKINILIFQYNNLLCNQCHDTIKRISKNIKLKAINLKSEDALNLNKSLIVVSSPVKFCNYIKQNKETVAEFIQNLNFLIIDEVDVIFDDPYMKHMDFIFNEIKKINDKFISIITSSTLSNKGKKSIYNNIIKYISNPVTIKTKYLHNIHPLINYHFVNLPTYNINTKIEVIKQIFSNKNYKKILIFCNTIKSCNQVYSLLKSFFDHIFIFNSSIKKVEQLDVLEHFKNIDQSVLVSTDIIYRGMDIKGISHLIHFDSPTNIIIYIHRNGRITRGASTGDIYIFNNLNYLITQKIYEHHKKNISIEEFFSRKRSLRKNYKRELKKHQIENNSNSEQILREK